MFGGKKESTSKNKNIMPAVTSHALNSLVNGTSITGDIVADSDIRIDGTIRGNLTCKSKLIIGPTGMVEGDVKCENAVIEGKFVGTLTVAEILHVKEAANIQGKITTGKIIVQSGAVFNVTCQMGQKAASSNGTFKSSQQQKEIAKEAATV